MDIVVKLTRIYLVGPTARHPEVVLIHRDDGTARTPGCAAHINPLSIIEGVGQTSVLVLAHPGHAVHVEIEVTARFMREMK